MAAEAKEKRDFADTQAWGRSILKRAKALERAAVCPAREAALQLMFAYTPSEALRGHMLSVEAAMVAYAREFAVDPLPYQLTGLLHDFDYEHHPELTDHPLVGCEILLERDYPSCVIEAILGHAETTGVARESQLAKTLFAVDELCGFLTAMAYVRPGGLAGLKFKSFRKKFKQKSFAAAVNRDELEQGAAELGVPFEEHVVFVAAALHAAFANFPDLG